MTRKHFCFAVVLLFVASFAGGRTEAAAQTKFGTIGAQKRIDVCKLLTSAEVQAVQGEAVTETKASPERSGGLAMSQCLFRTATPAKSVSVAVAVPGAAKAAGLTPRQLWRQQFVSEAGREVEERHSASKSSKKESEASSPRPIRGLGEEAYWVGNPIAGALYVLRGEKFVRISVGGIRKEAERIEKSTALARDVMARLD